MLNTYMVIPSGSWGLYKNTSAAMRFPNLKKFPLYLSIIFRQTYFIRNLSCQCTLRLCSVCDTIMINLELDLSGISWGWNDLKLFHVVIFLSSADSTQLCSFELTNMAIWVSISRIGLIRKKIRISFILSQSAKSRHHNLFTKPVWNQLGQMLLAIFFWGGNDQKLYHTTYLAADKWQWGWQPFPFGEQ